MKRLILIGGGIVLALVLVLVVGLNFIPDAPSPSDPSYSYTQEYENAQRKTVDEHDAIIIAQNKVKARLQSPDGVDFDLYSGKAFSKSQGLWVVKDYVTVNKTRVNYLMELRYEGGEPADPKSWTVTNVKM